MVLAHVSLLNHQLFHVLHPVTLRLCGEVVQQVGGSVPRDARQPLVLDESCVLHFVFGHQPISDASMLTIVKQLLYIHLVFTPLHVLLKQGHIPHLPLPCNYLKFTKLRVCNTRFQFFLVPHVGPGELLLTEMS